MFNTSASKWIEVSKLLWCDFLQILVCSLVNLLGRLLEWNYLRWTVEIGLETFQNTTLFVGLPREIDCLRGIGWFNGVIKGILWVFSAEGSMRSGTSFSLIAPYLEGFCIKSKSRVWWRTLVMTWVRYFNGVAAVEE